MYIIDDVCYAGEKTQNIKVKEAEGFYVGVCYYSRFLQEDNGFLIQRY